MGRGLGNRRKDLERMRKEKKKQMDKRKEVREIDIELIGMLTQPVAFAVLWLPASQYFVEN